MTTEQTIRSAIALYNSYNHDGAVAKLATIQNPPAFVAAAIAAYQSRNHFSFVNAMTNTKNALAKIAA